MGRSLRLSGRQRQAPRWSPSGTTGRLPDVTGAFSVVIPTLQRSPMLADVVALFAGHHLVREVIIINNAAPALGFGDRKVRILDQDENIFVNPAWNLGVREARSPYLIISNDDLVFPPRLVDSALRRLGPRTGIIGPDKSCFLPGRDGRARFRPTYELTHAFGTLMFMARSSYVPVPDQLKIFFGDDWLFYHQRRRNLLLRGPRVVSPMSVTSGSPEFIQQMELDKDVWRSTYAGDRPYHQQFRWEAAIARRVKRTTPVVV